MRFNHFHDQLLLTASSDSRVVLNSVPSLSSEPFGKLVDDLDEDDVDGEGDLESSVVKSTDSRLVVINRLFITVSLIIETSNITLYVYLHRGQST